MTENFRILNMNCECMDPSHTVRFTHYDDPDYEDPSITLEVHLNVYLPWYKRIMVAIKYILGIDGRSHWVDWDTVILNEREQARLMKYLKKVKKVNLKRKELTPVEQMNADSEV